MLTREDVIWCYNAFLLRPPESEEVVDGWLSQFQDFREMAHAFKESDESKHLIAQWEFTNQERAEINSLRERAAAIETKLQSKEDAQGWVPYVPRPPFLDVPTPGDFMSLSMCTAADFMNPRFAEICKAINHPFQIHRKLWEWVFVVHHLLKSGVVKEGARGLVFGVGAEQLPAYFASLGASIVATDAPDEISEANGWKETRQHSSNLSSLFHRDIISEEDFAKRVTYERCDMNHIPEHLTGFDFNWSSCCFEHLGDLEAGLDFVVNAVEKTLRVGGVAVHTTELNMSSNDETLKSGHTVIYRRRDLEYLIRRLRHRGHEVEELRISPGVHPLDFHVDMPPYRHDPHIKLMYDRFVTTSVGIVVKRGR